MRHTHAHTKKTDFTTNSLNNIEHTSYRFTSFFFLEEEEEKVEDTHQITKSSLQHLARSWYDGIVLKWIMCIFCVLLNMSVFLFSDIDSPLFRTNNAKEKRSGEKRSHHSFKRADYQWSSYPSSWRGTTSLMFTATILNFSYWHIYWCPSVLGLTCLFLDLFSLQHGCAGRLRPMRCLWIHQD